jgi:hypothetical protein
MNPIRAWNRFFFGPISARPLGAFRIAIGLIALANLALLSADLDYWFTDAGLLQGTEAREAAGPLRFSLLHWVQDPWSVRVYFMATATVAVLLTIGWHSRLMAVLLYLGMISIHHRNVSSNCGSDALLVIMLFYLMLSPCGAAYSLDARRAARRRGTPAEPLIVPWAQRLVQIQLALIYLATALYKCNGSTWYNGTALHYILHNTEVGRFQLDPLLRYPLVIDALTHAALFAELALPILLWFRALRPWALAMGIGLHLGVMLTVNIPIFGELMTACYLAFLTPEELDALLRPFNPRNWFARRRRGVVNGRVDGPSALRGPHALDAARGPTQLTLFERD